MAWPGPVVRHYIGNYPYVLKAIIITTMTFTTTSSNKNNMNFWSRKFLVLMLSACTLLSTACQKDEVKPASEQKNIEQVSKNLNAIKPVTVQIKSDNSGATGN
jgi:hypothetical protein